MRLHRLIAVKPRLLILLTVAGIALVSCGGNSRSNSGSTTTEAGLVLTSAGFEDNEAIPAEYTCLGKDASPQLLWSGVPVEAAELTLIVEDPDAPDPPFVHWVVYGLDPSMRGLV